MKTNAKKMAYTTRELVLLAVFGALWGVVEISLGSVLHALHVPMRGVFLAAIGVGIALIGRLFVPRRGSVIFIGALALLLKLFSLGGVVLGPMVGIIAEALAAELALLLWKRPGRLAFASAGALAALWTLIQPFFTGLLFFGLDVVSIGMDLVDEGSRLFGLPPSAGMVIVLALVIIRLLIGAAAGLLAWQAGRLLMTRRYAGDDSELQPGETRPAL